LNFGCDFLELFAWRMQDQLLRAPLDGTVQQLALHTIGGVVTPAQALMVVVPTGAGIEIEAMIPNKDIGFVSRQGHSAEGALTTRQTFGSHEVSRLTDLP
jgi:hemolysin D